MDKRGYVLYDERGSEIGIVLEYVGDYSSDRKAINEASKNWTHGALYSYRIEGNRLEDEILVTNGEF